MNEELISRLIKVRKSLNLSQKDFAFNIGLTPSAISDIERNQAPVTKRTILAICYKFNVNEEWLKTGKGSMFIVYDKKHDEFFSTFKDLHPVLQDFLIKTAKNLLEAQKDL